MDKWEPKGGIIIFGDRCLEKRGIGKTWRAIAKEEGVSRSTLYEWFDQNPDFKAAIKTLEKEEQGENIHQTLLEVALKNKNVPALIYLAKAKLKMFDTPNAASPDESKKEELFSPVTRSEWKEKHEALQKKKAAK